MKLTEEQVSNLNLADVNEILDDMATQNWDTTTEYNNELLLKRKNEIETGMVKIDLYEREVLLARSKLRNGKVIEAYDILEKIMLDMERRKGNVQSPFKQIILGR
jgi:hypothetical protein